ncbi:DUF6081 family protein [Streptomyces sp. NBC_00075]|uniref:DUF6081 family protein n=1 Tax=Streptomyces sp. NBC_00075 TaxID=2975641 RepID=UPI00324854CC
MTSRIVWEDDFGDGFDIEGAHPRWTYAAVGPHTPTDGVVTTTPKGLRVAASGVNKETGAPAYTLTIPQEKSGDDLPGALDHIKWLVYASHQTPSEPAGFEVESGRELAFHAWMSGETYGTKDHPFGDAVHDPESDIRLGAAAMNVMDAASGQVFDFLITNERIYAVYERLPMLRAHLGDYASFTTAIPVVNRSPQEEHHLTIAYDAEQGVARWLVDDAEVHRVTEVGHRPERRNMLLDHGGQDALVTPSRLHGGFGLVTLLDGALHGAPGLVRLSPSDGVYFHPGKGAPHPQTFVDEESRPDSRLFGQGAALRVRRFAVESRTAHAPAEH